MGTQRSSPRVADSQNTGGLRAHRWGGGLEEALRGLRCADFFPAPAGMRILVTLLLDTLPMLGNVLLLCFFVFFIFGIIGVQLWAGLLRNRCFLEENFTM